MAHIEVISKPKGAGERYQYFKNKDTGQEWKAAIELRQAAAPTVIAGNEELSPTTLAVTITVSPIKSNGKTLRDEENRPIVIDSLTHTFTAIEMEAADFDPEARIVGIVAERIHAGEIKLQGNKKLKSIIDKWGGKTKLKTSPVKFEGKEE